MWIELIKANYVKKFPYLFTSLGRSKSHRVYINFKDSLNPRQIKGRKKSIHIQDRVSEELKALVRYGHITKLDKCTTDHFINRIVINSNKDGSIKLVMDAKFPKFANLEKIPNFQYSNSNQLQRSSRLGVVYLT